MSEPLRILPLEGADLTVKMPGHTVHVKCAHGLTYAAKHLFEMAQGLGDDQCLVLDRQAQRVGVFEIKQALLLDAGEFLVIQNARGTGVCGQVFGE